MSSISYPRYFYSDIEFPKSHFEKNTSSNCGLDGFFQFYCSLVTSRTNDYLARLPAFDQCLSSRVEK
ncbi:hypothetical protein I4U23_029058 [Adineta vaga]|nr:hypothetical protein I4U23_029058 [Adineta vaga]